MSLLQLAVMHSLTISVVSVRLPPLLQTLTDLESQPLPVVPAVCFSQVLSEQLQFISSQHFSLPSKDSILCSSELMDYCSVVFFCSASNSFGKVLLRLWEQNWSMKRFSLFYFLEPNPSLCDIGMFKWVEKVIRSLGQKFQAGRGSVVLTPVSSLTNSPIWSSSGLCSGPIWSWLALMCGWIR